ncbi:hypothetical protein [Halocatena marina]|uniref:hypothetical protein n=1 Tax=Halocatena marina TaxID=2934937 RepID=UPI00200D817A|nr:hypothetical protein [Halocatena marina]
MRGPFSSVLSHNSYERSVWNGSDFRPSGYEPPIPRRCAILHHVRPTVSNLSYRTTTTLVTIAATATIAGTTTVAVIATVVTVWTVATG